MGCCSAVGCSNTREKGFALYRFPTGEQNRERRRIWVANVRRDKWTPNANSRLCEIHFDKHQFEIGRQDGWKKLKLTAVPTLFSRSVKNTSRKLRKTGRVVPYASRPCTKDACLPISSTPCLAAETLVNDVQCHSDTVPEILHADSFPQTDNPCKQEVLTWSQKESSAESPEAQTPEPFATKLETKHQDHLYSTAHEGPQSVQSYCRALIEAPCVPASSTAGLAVPTPVDGRHATPLKLKYEDRPCNMPLDGPQAVPPLSHPIIEDHCMSAASTTGSAADTLRHTVNSQWNSKVDGHTQTDTPCLPGLPASFQIVQLVQYATEQEKVKDLSEDVAELKRKVQALQKKNNALTQEMKRIVEGLRVVFTEDQTRALGRTSNHGNAWSPATIQKALELHLACGSAGYNLLLSQGQPLPAERTLRGHLLRGVKFDPGVVGEKLGPTKVKVSASKPGVAMIDEGEAVVIALYDGSHEFALGL
uniref:THAP-type domain-containing protein n=1 Tax=Ixodes ricinus TaxID=34613 RepID=A0A131XUU3_IXORI